MPKALDRWSVNKLEAAVRRHNRRYFALHRPVIPDAEFDRLVEVLKRRKPDSPVLEEIGSDLSMEPRGETRGDRPAVRHRTPMLSLDKCYDETTAADWAAKFAGTVIASPKIDGCAVSLRYDAEGRLIQGATRGNGIVGEDITPNVRYIADIPQRIPLKKWGQSPKIGTVPISSMEVRGEIYMPLSVFTGYKEQFANPRNLAAGAIKQKDPRKTGAYRLRFWAYDLVGTDAGQETEKRKRLAKAGFPVIASKEVPKEKIPATYEEFLARRTAWDFETDGVVFKANDVAEQERLQSTIHHPRYAIAYKFQGDSGMTRLVDVCWSVSRTGTITPVGIVEPVALSGAVVTRVSLHNVGLMQKLGVGKGATVLMMRRGGVIPNLESVVEPGKEHIPLPKQCPSCGAPVELRDDFLYCSNAKGCLRSKMGELKHFMRVIACEGFGDKLLEKLVANSLISDPADFYTLQVKDLLDLERMGETLATKLINRIQERRELPLDLFLRALGIRELAKRTSQVLAQEYGTLDRLLKARAEDLAAIHGIGEVIAREVIAGLKTRRSLIQRLLQHVKIRTTHDARRMTTGPLAGKSVLFTGALVAMERKQAERLVEGVGGTAAGGVSKQLDYLVVGAGGGAGSKLTKAQALVKAGASLRILREKEFLKLVGYRS